MIGELKASGVGEPTEHVDIVPDVCSLKQNIAYNNKVMLRELREDEHARELFSSTCDDALAGRMSKPEPVQHACSDQLFLNPRFGVAQLKEDGTTKIRPVDHLSWSPGTGHELGIYERPTRKARKAASVNGHVATAEKMRHDTLDMLAATMNMFVDTLREVPGLIKVIVHICGVASMRHVNVASC